MAESLLFFVFYEWCWHQAFFFILMASSPAGPAQTMLNTVVLVFTLLAGLIVFLRLFTRGLLLHKAGAEDVWISFAMVGYQYYLEALAMTHIFQVLSVGLTVAIALQISNGLGMHLQDLSPAMMLNSQKVSSTPCVSVSWTHHGLRHSGRAYGFTI